MKKVGRPVKLDGINVNSLQKWLSKDPKRKEAIKCQALISLTKGVSVKDVCSVLNVTRETISDWRKNIATKGIKYLDRKTDRGRITQLTNDIRVLLKKAVLQSPSNFEFNQVLWDGKLVVKFLQEQCDLNISVRTAQYWLHEIGFTRQRPRLIFKQASKKEKAKFKEDIKKTRKKTEK